jgi:hypothetical protein
MPAPVMRSRTAVAASLVLALVQFRFLYFILGSDYPGSIAAAFGVVHGRPHWRIYQSRLLGPYLVDSVTHVMPSSASAYVLVTIVTLAIAGLLACRLGNRIAGAPGAWRALLATHAAFAFLLAKPWLYIWDYFDLVVFLVFALFVIEKRPTLWFVLLCLLGMLNHEIAMFVGMWLVIDAVIVRVRGARLPWGRLAAGIGSMVVGLVVVEMLRRALLVEELGPKIFVDAPKGVGSSFYFTLFHNAHDLGLILTHWDYRLLFMIIAFVAALPFVAWWIARRDRALESFAIVNVLMLGSLLAFGLLIESRIYIVLIPMLATAAALTAEAAPRAA